jgi:hypothetical protein
MRRYSVAFILIVSEMLFSNDAAACPAGQYEQCVLGACVCLPEIGGDVGRASEHLKKEFNGQVGGNALAIWIQQSHDTAIGTSQPIPPQIRQALTGYIEDDILNRVRFKVGDNGILNLAGLTIAYGDRVFGSDVDAVTLIDLVVFRNENDAYNNPALWAHELTHVKQFRDSGVQDFSIRYARNSNDLEGPAYEVGNNYWSWRSQAGAANLPPSFPAPAPQMIGNFCLTPFGKFGPGTPNSVGAQCWIQTPNGLVYGQISQ